MPTLTTSSQDISTLKIHKFPSKSGLDSSGAYSLVAAQRSDGDAVRTAVIIN